ncbi:MAG: WYL domain-containing protein [Propionibacteriaceae bacterium]|nr:WYL domain-containing protein [Propionibacteriaceae bacterium]
MTSIEQVNRMLALVPYLQARPDGADLAQTAAAFAVTPKQLLADLEVLWFCGLPGGLPGDLIEVDIADTGWIRLSNAEYLGRPLRFSPDEAMSLVVALQLVRELGGPDLAEATDGALAKLTGAHTAARPPVVVEVASGSAEIRRQLAAAIERDQVVRLTYDGQTRAETTTPLVEPKRLAVRDGYGYLDAWSLERDDWRVYRLDRIAEVAVTGESSQDRGAPPSSGSGWLDERPDAAEVTLVLAPAAAWITEYIPVRSSTQTPAGLEVTLLVADPAWLRALLLRLGKQVRSVRPAQAATSAREAAREALAQYG